jgi:hypothetical protein
MRDIEFRQVRSFEGLPDGGPRTEESPASYSVSRFIELESSAAVNGERIAVHPGDFISPPART